MQNEPCGLEAKPVYDWNRRPLGTVLGSELDPRTRDAKSLIIGLSDDARELLGTDEETMLLPFEYVFGIRRDEVRLNRDAHELPIRVAARAPERRLIELAPMP